MNAARLIRLNLVAALMLTLTGCGFQPLYGNRGDGLSVASDLSAVDIPEQTTRVGQLIRNELISTMSPPGQRRASAYRLDLMPSTQDNVALESRSTDVLRRTYRLKVDFALVDIQSGKPVFSGKTFSNVSYDRTDASFANVQALDNAQMRAAREVGTDIRTRLAAHFSGI